MSLSISLFVCFSLYLCRLSLSLSPYCSYGYSFKMYATEEHVERQTDRQSQTETETETEREAGRQRETDRETFKAIKRI